MPISVVSPYAVSTSSVSTSLATPTTPVVLAPTTITSTVSTATTSPIYSHITPIASDIGGAVGSAFYTSLYAGFSRDFTYTNYTNANSDPYNEQTTADGKNVVNGMNPDEYASFNTAQTMAKQYGCKLIDASESSQGTVVPLPPQWSLVTSSGTILDAGLLQKMIAAFGANSPQVQEQLNYAGGVAPAYTQPPNYAQINQALATSWNPNAPVVTSPGS